VCGPGGIFSENLMLIVSAKIKSYNKKLHGLLLELEPSRDARHVCLAFTAPTHGVMTRLSCRAWLFTCQDGIAARRRSPIQVLTGLDVEFTLLIETNMVYVTT